MNKYKEHLIIIPEDRANEEIANGFVTRPNIAGECVKILNVANGWAKAVGNINKKLKYLKKYPDAIMVLLIDFDNHKSRGKEIKNNIPSEFENRIFVLGVLSEPEKLCAATGYHEEKIGGLIAEDCPGGQGELWDHDLLRHNQPKLTRLTARVKNFLIR